MVKAFIAVNRWIRVKSDDQVCAFLLGHLQKVQMTNVEQIEGPGNVDNFIVSLWALAVAELNDFLRRRQKLGAACPGAARRVVLAHSSAWFPVNGVLAVSLLEVLPCHQQHSPDQISR